MLQYRLIGWLKLLLSQDGGVSSGVHGWKLGGSNGSLSFTIDDDSSACNAMQCNQYSKL
jgi:hypothetical protein